MIVDIQLKVLIAPFIFSASVMTKKESTPALQTLLIPTFFS